METFAQTERTTLKRLPKRGVYDRELVYRILDEGFICHVGFANESQPFVIPTGYARFDDKLYIHGSQASRMLRTLSTGIDVCVTVTLVDGLVLARSAFHHSMNYRSVVVFGQATVVDERAEKLDALRALSQRPGIMCSESACRAASFSSRSSTTASTSSKNTRRPQRR